MSSPTRNDRKDQSPCEPVKSDDLFLAKEFQSSAVVVEPLYDVEGIAYVIHHAPPNGKAIADHEIDLVSPT